MISFYAAIDSGNLSGVQSFVNNLQTFLEQSNLVGKYKIDLNFRDANGDTPLIRASRQPNTDVVKYLSERGVDVNAVNARGESALVASYNSGQYANSQFLISRGAVDTYDVAGRLRSIQAARAAAATTSGASGSTVASSAVLYQWAGALAAGGLAAGGAALVAGGGSKGGGSPFSPPLALNCGGGDNLHPTACPASAFVTGEAQGQEGVLALKAQHALSHGYDGRIFARDGSGALLDDQPDGYVTVAIIDSGVDLSHTDLDANVMEGFSVTCNSAGCVSGGLDTSGHGTAVAGILLAERNGIGMHGIAPEARFFSVSIANSSGALTNGDAPGIAYALTNGAQVLNGSYGFTTPIINATDLSQSSFVSGVSPASLRSYLTTDVAGTTFLAQYQSIVASNAIMVYAAGNDPYSEVQFLAGLPAYFQGAVAPAGISQTDYDIVNPEQYDWSRNWVAAVSLNDSGTISSFSNRCGISKDWCLAAPGEIAMTTADGGGYTSGSGTSYSAPNISGAIAVMLGAFPQLDPEDVLQILFDTADDLGDPGVDEVYGHGLVNLQKATDPSTGGWTLSLSSFSVPFSLQTSGFSLSAPFGNALDSSPMSMLFLDKYGKDYLIPLSSVSRDLISTRNAEERFYRFGESGFDNVIPLSATSKVSFSSEAQLRKPDNEPKSNTSGLGKLAYDSSIITGPDEAATLSLNYNTNLAEARMQEHQRRLVASDAHRNPYLNLTDAASGVTMGYQWGQWGSSMTAYSAKFENEYGYQYDNRKGVRGVYSEYSYSSKDKRAQVALGQGVNIEDRSLLGSESSGAFAIDNANTYHAGVTGRYLAAKGLTLLGSYNVGVTQVNAADTSVFRGFSNIVTNAFAAGAELADVGGKGNTLGFAISQPLRVASGRAHMDVPVQLTSSGVRNEARTLNLAPSARELDVETYYALHPSEKSQISLNALYRINPNNDAANDNEAALMTKYRRSF